MHVLVRDKVFFHISNPFKDIYKFIEELDDHMILFIFPMFSSQMPIYAGLDPLHTASYELYAMDNYLLVF